MMSKLKKSLSVALPFAAVMALAGCLAPTGEERASSEKPLPVAAAVSHHPTRYAMVTWENRSFTGGPKRIVFGAGNHAVVLGTSNYLDFHTPSGWMELGHYNHTSLKAMALEPVSGQSVYMITSTNETVSTTYYMTDTYGGMLAGNVPEGNWIDISASTDPAGPGGVGLFAVNTSGSLYRRVKKEGKPTDWSLIPGQTAKSVAAGPGGVPWIINSSNNVCSYKSSSWTCHGGTASRIAVGLNGSVWMVGLDKIGSTGNSLIYFLEQTSTGTKWLRANGTGVDIAVDKDGLPWIITYPGVVYAGTQVYLSDAATSLVQWGAPYTALSTGNGLATDVAKGPNDELWAISRTLYSSAGGDFKIERSEGGQWKVTGGAAIQVDVGQNGIPWVRNSSNQVWVGNSIGSYFGQEAGVSASEIGVGANGTGWYLGTEDIGQGANRRLYRKEGSTWKATQGFGTRVDIGPNNVPWLVNAAGDVWVGDNTGTNWSKRSGIKARDIGVGANGDAWVVSDFSSGINKDYVIFRYQNYKWVNVGGGGIKISVDKAGKAWIVNDAGKIYRAP